MRTFAVALFLVLAACGGSGDEPTKAAKTSATPGATTTKPTVAPPEGTPAPEALSRFRCAKNAKGAWSSSGHLANRTKAKVTYQVTVYIGEAAGGVEQARTRQVPDVAAGGSTRFVISNVPAPDDGGTCHVQVLAQG
ncbi:hypothetical protein [Aeromicrobium sp. NPDC092404]|uniref:hypothetical protein n=1 Tax=Aeromicrobium sp. NPDC092404 TaxID=3154976 RepID=UPI003426E787